MPESAAVGDLNGDKADDVVVANTVSDNLSILLGDGHGGFAAAPPVPAASAWYVVIGDLNRDRKPDLAVSNLFGNSVSILLGDGTGGFTAAPIVPVGSFPYGIAIGDFDHNYKPDLAVANQFAQSVSILLGNGAGGFSPAGAPITVGSGPSWLAADDLNGDGRDDLAVANQGSDTVSILLGDGAGGFSEAPGSPTLVGNCFRPGHGCGPTGLVIGKVDGDDRLDLATSNVFSDNVSVFLGDGAGRFTASAGSPYAVGDGPFSLVLARLDQNGSRDIGAANSFSSDVSVLLNTKVP